MEFSDLFETSSYQVLKSYLTRDLLVLKSPAFQTDFTELDTRFDTSTKKGRCELGTAQENLLIVYQPRFGYLPEQRSGKETGNWEDNQRLGDLIYRDYLFDLKISDSNNPALVGSITKSSVENFVRDGYYLCISHDLTKHLFIPHRAIKYALDKDLVTYHDNYIRGIDLERIFGQYCQV